MAKKHTRKKTHTIPMNLPPPGWHQTEIVTITWDSANPVAAGGYCDAGLSVTCTLTGPNDFSSTLEATVSGTSWNVNFGTAPATDTYQLLAVGSDGSNFGVTIDVVVVVTGDGASSGARTPRPKKSRKP